MSRNTVFVICPTEYGGQIEHAFDTAAALTRHPAVHKVALLTRPGAVEYLKSPTIPGLEICEVFPARRVKSDIIRNAFRPFLQVLDVLSEHFAIRNLLSKSRAEKVLLVLDTSRYPIPRLLTRAEIQTKIAIFVHNARPHVSERRRSLRDRVLLTLERKSINGADLVVTHGDQQLATLSSYTKTQIVSVALPTTSFLDRPDNIENAFQHTEPFALCIGEIRENKGVAFAIEAAKEAKVDLIVAGKSHSESLADGLAKLADDHSGILIIDDFLDKSQFDSLIGRAHVILLPYTHFDAQSGILAKAMKAGKQIIASDLPSLREQADGYSRVEFVPQGNVKELKSKLTKVMASRPSGTAVEPQTPEEEWKAVADILLSHV